MNLEKAFNKAWYDKSKWTYIFLPILPIIRHLVLKKRQSYLEKSYLKRSLEKSQKNTSLNTTDKDCSVTPIIVVGNITVGGTGKSPMVIALASLLKRQGLKVGIVSRGYGVNASQPLFVDPTSSPSDCGDEPVMLAKRTKSPLVICQDRSAAVEHLVQNQDIDVIISDDGMQHYAMRRDIEIVMLDSERGLGNGHLLPVGPLREPASRLSEVDFVTSIIANSFEQKAKLSLLEKLIPKIYEKNKALADIFYPLPLYSECLLNVMTGERKELDWFSTIDEWHVIAGIGNPERFLNTLKKSGLKKYTKHWFSDHYHFQTSDFPSGGHVIMTEKDAVKCQELEISHPNLWYLSVAVRLPAEFEVTLLNKLK